MTKDSETSHNESSSINSFLQDWLRLHKEQQAKNNQFNSQSEDWIDIPVVGRFKGLKIIADEDKQFREISITLTYEKYDKPRKSES